MNNNNKKYRPISLLKYNITLETNNIVDFTNNPTKYNFLSSEDSKKGISYLAGKSKNINFKGK